VILDAANVEEAVCGQEGGGRRGRHGRLVGRRTEGAGLCPDLAARLGEEGQRALFGVQLKIKKDRL
jgi:hypothetical protein